MGLQGDNSLHWIIPEVNAGSVFPITSQWRKDWENNCIIGLKARNFKLALVFMMSCGLKINHPDIREMDFSSTVVIFTGADGILVDKMR